MGLFSDKKRDDVPETVSDGKWWQVQKAAAREVDVLDTPWTDPKKAAKKRAWNGARDNAESN